MKIVFDVGKKALLKEPVTPRGKSCPGCNESDSILLCDACIVEEYIFDAGEDEFLKELEIPVDREGTLKILGKLNKKGEFKKTKWNWIT